MYEATTANIRVSVIPEFWEPESDPEDHHFFWAYTIEIENLSSEQVQLESRYWRIIDGKGQTEEVHGAGVVGEQPILQPGESFEYTSGVPLATPSGFMGGRYTMLKLDGSRFDVEVPTFSLDYPADRSGVH